MNFRLASGHPGSPTSPLAAFSPGDQLWPRAAPGGGEHRQDPRPQHLGSCSGGGLRAELSHALALGGLRGSLEPQGEGHVEWKMENREYPDAPCLEPMPTLILGEPPQLRSHIPRHRQVMSWVRTTTAGVDRRPQSSTLSPNALGSRCGLHGRHGTAEDEVRTNLLEGRRAKIILFRNALV